MSATNEKHQIGDIVGPVMTRDEGFVEQFHLGYDAQLKKSRSFVSISGTTLAIVAVPYGIGGPLLSAIYGGGQLSLFVGVLVVLLYDGCVALSLADLASRYPTSGVYYWSYKLCLPLCFTLPPLEAILTTPYGQALPLTLDLVMGSMAGTLVLMVIVLFFTLFCSISISTAAFAVLRLSVATEIFLWLVFGHARSPIDLFLP